MALRLVSTFVQGSVEKAIFEKLMTTRRELLADLEPADLFELIDVAGSVAREMGAGESSYDYGFGAQQLIKERVAIQARVMREGVKDNLDSAMDSLASAKAILDG